MITKTMLQKENDALRQRVAELETQLARQEQTGLALQEKRGGRDIIERKQAQERLKNSEAFLDGLIEQSPLPMWISDEHGNLIRLNQACCDLLHITPEEVIGRYNIFRDNLVIEQGFLPQVRAVFEHGETAQFEINYDSLQVAGLQLQQTVKVSLSVTIFPIKDTNDRITHAVIQHKDITERKRTEAERQALAKFPGENPSPVMRVSYEGRLLYGNQSSLVVLNRWHCTVGQPIPTSWNQLNREVLDSGVSQEVEIVCGERIYSLIFSPIVEDRYVNIYGYDITERKRAEEALRESEARLQMVVDNSRDGINLLDLRTGKYIFMSPSQIAMTGFTAEEMNDFPIEEAYERVHPDDRAISVGQQQQIAAGQNPPSTEYRWKVKNGEYRWFSDNRGLVRDPQGNLIAMVGISRDITERKQAEAALNESEAKYRLLVETSNEGVWMMDKDHRTTYVNQAMAGMLGYVPTEVLGKKVEDFFFAEDMAFHNERMSKRHTGHDEVYERRFKQRDGSALWTLVSARVIKDSQGEFNGSFAMFTDITERKQVEESLHKNEALLSEAQRIGHVGHWEWTAPGQALLCSEELRRILELPQSGPILHETIKARVSPAEQARLFELDQKAFANRGNLDYEFSINRSNGQLSWLHQQVSVTYAEDGRPVRMIGVIQDITERKQAEVRLQASTERFNAFFINTPLQAVIYRFIRDPQGQIMDWEISDINPLGAASLSQPADTLIGQRASALLGQEVFDPYLELSRQVAATDQPRLFETHFETNGRDYLSSVFMVGADHYANVSVDITKRKQAERELHIALEKYRVLFETFPLGISITDATGNLLETNQESERLLGLSRQNHLRRTYDSPEWRIIRPDGTFMPPEEYASVRALKEKRLVENVEMGIVKDGDEITWLSVTAAPIPLEGYGVVIAYGEITERKRAEAALRESETKHRLISETISDYIYAGLIYPDGRVKTDWIIGAVQAITGYSEAELKALPYGFASLINPEDLAAVMAQQPGLLAGEPTVVEYRITTQSGEKRWLRDYMRPFQNETHAPAIQLLGAVQDITERKRVEEALQESEHIKTHLLDKLNEAQHLATIGSWEWDLLTNIVWWSEEIYQIFGVRPEEFIPSFEANGRFIHPDDFAKYYQVFEHSLHTGEPLDVELRLITNDGQLKHSQAKGKVIHNDFGQPIRFIGTVMDITERKRTEAALRESEERFRLFMDNSPTIAWIQDDQSRYVYLNHTYEERFGVQLEAWRGKTIFEVWSPEEAQQLWQNDQKVLEAGHLLEFTEEIPNPDGSLRTWWSFKFPFQDAAGQRYVAGIALDITQQQQVEEERAKLKEQLHQAQKMESIGRLAGGVAHDFNNLLTVILGYSELMQTRLPLSGLALERLEQIRQAAKRAEGLTRQLLAFSRKQVLVPEVFDLNGLVTNLRKMLERLIPEDIVLVTVLQPDLWWIKADPGQLEQVIMNLAVNARDAMPGGGRLTIETANVPDGGFPETLRVPGVRLTVTDTGCGMDETTLAHIFEPFFTTKEKGKGTGLGLSTVYGIVKQSGGEVTVDSQPGKGAAFSLYLPAHETVLTNSTTPQPEAVAQSGRETILLVEDEPIVRDFVQAALRDYGYTLLEVDHGYQALALARQEKSIDLLLTDVVMPDINGRELAERVKALHPHLKVLFMSGYMDDEVIQHGVQMAEVEFIAKPFSPVVLAAKVRAILDR